ncbi:MAG TPA: aquaporin [Dehalococcoidia bacterium]|nr:aquaporin [Dehalococcoidia bacterium]
MPVYESHGSHASQTAARRKASQNGAVAPPDEYKRSARQREPDRDNPHNEGRRLLAELLGTFALTMAAAGGEVIAHVSDGQVSEAAKVVAPGLTVMALVYAMGDVSGAHFNPGVTLAFAVRRVFPWSRLPGYWAAQLCGALLAAAVLRLMFGDVAHVGATEPHHGAATALGMEIILTWLLVTVILGTATRYALIGADAALAVGATIALDGLFAGPISGASMNPARSLGPAIVAAHLTDAWLYVVGPFAGALIAVGTTWLVHGHHKAAEEKAASGEGGEQRG